ncbi:MAG: hypothetical protein ACF8TS_03875 [Maioricimonas sp. JB049]
MMLLVTQILAGIALLGGILVAGNRLRKRRNVPSPGHPWESLARSLRLKFDHGDSELKLTGRVDNRAVAITAAAGRPKGTPAQASLCIELLTPLPAAFVLTRMGNPLGISGEGNKADGLARYRRNWTVSGVSRDFAEDFLSPPRLAVLRQLERICGSASVGIWEGALYWTERLPIEAVDVVEDRFRKLHMSARDLDDCPLTEAIREQLRQDLRPRTLLEPNSSDGSTMSSD